MIGIAYNILKNPYSRAVIAGSTLGVAAGGLALGAALYAGYQDRDLYTVENNATVDNKDTTASIEEIDKEFAELCLVGVKARVENSKATNRQEDGKIGGFIPQPRFLEKEYRTTGDASFDNAICNEPTRITGFHDPNTGETQLNLSTEDMYIRQIVSDTEFRRDGNGWADLSGAVADAGRVFTGEGNESGAAEQDNKILNFLQNAVVMNAAEAAKSCTTELFTTNESLALAYGKKVADTAATFINIDRSADNKLDPANISILLDDKKVWPLAEINDEDTPFRELRFQDAPGTSLSDLLANKEFGNLSVDSITAEGSNENMCTVSEDVQELIDTLPESGTVDDRTFIPGGGGL